MNPVFATIAVAAISGITATLLALRDVAVDAPHVEQDTLRGQLWAHPTLVRLLRRRPPAAPLTGAALLLASAIGVTIASFLGVVLLMISSDRGLARSDLPLARWARDHATDGASDLLRSISLLGGTEVVIGLGVLVAVIGARRGPTRGVVAFVAMTVGGQFAIVNAVKWTIDRARPDLAQLTGYAGASFPSGHAAAAAATWACAAMILGRRQPRAIRAVLTGTGVAVTTAVGATRVFLGVHWFTDVLAGLVLGWGWFAVCSLAFGGRDLDFGQPVEQAEQLTAR